MKLAAAWTMMMSIALAIVVTVACALAFGGGLLAWLVAGPAMFVALHVCGLPVVMLCELAENAKLLPRAWRPLVDEMLVVALLIGLASLVLPMPLKLVVVVGFVGMYLLRLCLFCCWSPGEPVEVQT